MREKTIVRHKSTKELKVKRSVYKQLGIDDVSAFYAEKFVWETGPSIVEHDPLSRFDIAYLKKYWIYNGIREGAKVLDVGCGPGTLNLIKSKHTYLVGSDLSEKGLEQALLAGYDEAVLCDSHDIPLPDKSFDFIVSLDFLGHIENEVKDAYLIEWIRLLKDDGVMLHGLEADDIDYDRLSESEKRHILIDGHVGLESFDRVEERFKRFFHDVVAENCMGSCCNWYDIEKYEKTESRIGKEFRDHILSFSLPQIKAFNTAMLLMRNLLVKDNLIGKAGGFMFVKAQKKRVPPIPGKET